MPVASKKGFNHKALRDGKVLFFVDEGEELGEFVLVPRNNLK